MNKYEPLATTHDVKLAKANLVEELVAVIAPYINAMVNKAPNSVAEDQYRAELFESVIKPVWSLVSDLGEFARVQPSTGIRDMKHRYEIVRDKYSPKAERTS